MSNTLCARVSCPLSRENSPRCQAMCCCSGPALSSHLSLHSFRNEHPSLALAWHRQTKQHGVENRTKSTIHRLECRCEPTISTKKKNVGNSARSRITSRTAYFPVYWVFSPAESQSVSCLFPKIQKLRTYVICSSKRSATIDAHTENDRNRWERLLVTRRLHKKIFATHR